MRYRNENVAVPAPIVKVYNVNFALASNGTIASASSSELSAADAIDGDNSTRWESAKGDPLWFLLDLGQNRIFNTIQIRWEAAYSKTFTVEISSDNSNWTTLLSVNRTLSNASNYEEQFLFDFVNAKYVKFTSTARGTQWANSFYEFRVLALKTTN